MSAPWTRALLPALVAAAVLLRPTDAAAACCYFSAKDQDILQPAQKAFITWDPQKQVETFTVQPKFEGNAVDFGMVIPTPTQPKLHEMPRDFFKHLAVYSIMKKREMPRSKIVNLGGFGKGGGKKAKGGEGDPGVPPPEEKKPAVVVLEAGLVGSLDYKIIEAGRADALFKWLKDNKYHYSGDEATLNFYVQKKWIFTVMKIDTMQMKKNKDGTYLGEVTPTRFEFTSEKLVYPLKITQISVKDKTEALFYVQAPFKVDLQGDMSYQYQWVPMLKAITKPKSKIAKVRPLPGKADAWLEAIEDQIPSILKRGQELGYTFVRGKRPTPNAKGQTVTTIEWARHLTDTDIDVLRGKAPYSDKMPNLDEGLDPKDPNKTRAELVQIVRERLKKVIQDRPDGFLVRHAPEEDLKALQQLVGHLRAGLFVTKFRRIFTRGEMSDDLEIVRARYGNAEDNSEYEEILPTSPP